jgi:HlyD family secretion protein
VAQARVSSPKADAVAAQVNLARAQDAVDAAQIAYHKALDRPWEPQEVRDGLAKALWHAELELTLAQARMDGALVAQRAHAIGVEALISQRVAAEEQLTQTLSSGLPYTTTLALLEAEAERARLQLDGLRSWQNPHLRAPHPDEVAQARALLRQAELAMEQLAWRLKGAQLRAPFDGVVSAVYSRPGEWCAAGAPVIALVDTGSWYVETRNVGELTIGRVSVGQETQVQVMAVDGEELRGQVKTISPVAVVQQGDTTYTLIIALEPTDLPLWPGMNAKVEIRPD